MSLDQVPTGKDVPHEINVVIEIPLDSEAVKYEVDKSSGQIFVDRMLSTAMRYPCNYGYIPHTLCGDGDPLDVLVVMPVKLIPGCVVRCRPIGMLKMEDDAGDDSKLIAVPITKVTPLYRQVANFSDLPELTCDQIEHFFKHYKDLERGKWVKVIGWRGAEDAKREIVECVARFDAEEKKPNF